MSPRTSRSIRGDQTTARGWAQESLLLSRELGDRIPKLLLSSSSPQIAAEEGDEAAYEDLVSSAAAIFRELGADIPLVGLMHDDGLRALRAGDYARARASLEEALEQRAKPRAPGTRSATTLCDLGVLALYERRFDDALRLFAESLPLASAKQLALQRRVRPLQA